MFGSRSIAIWTHHLAWHLAVTRRLSRGREWDVRRCSPAVAALPIRKSSKNSNNKDTTFMVVTWLTITWLGGDFDPFCSFLPNFLSWARELKLWWHGMGSSNNCGNLIPISKSATNYNFDKWSTEMTGWVTPLAPFIGWGFCLVVAILWWWVVMLGLTPPPHFLLIHAGSSSPAPPDWWPALCPTLFLVPSPSLQLAIRRPVSACKPGNL